MLRSSHSFFQGGAFCSRAIQAMCQFASDRRGNVSVLFGLSIVASVVLIGGGVDIGRWMQARKQTQEAIDSAALAGLRTYQASNDVAKAVQIAQSNYAYNVRKRAPVVSDTIAFVLRDNNTSMTATGAVHMNTPFFNIINLRSLPLLKLDGSEHAITKIALGGNAGTNLEVSVMIDITGSMGESDHAGSTKIETVKAAAKSLVDILVWDDQSVYTSKVAVIPFSETVNLGTTAIADAARDSILPGTSNQPGHQGYTVDGDTFWSSETCVTERNGAHAFDDHDPASAPVGWHYSGDGSCPTATPMIPLSSNKVLLKAMIGGLSPGGWTAGQTGTAWAWYTLSPNFNGLWPAANAARPYAQLTALTAKGKPVLRKIAVLMTDGDYNTQYCNGVGNHNITCAGTEGSSESQAGQLCSGMKAKGIEVYTIGAQVSDAAKAFLKSCATDEAHYYDATNGTKLTQAFIDIAYKLVPPYISH